MDKMLYKKIMVLHVTKEMRDADESLFKLQPKKTRKRVITGIMQTYCCWWCTYKFAGIPCIIPQSEQNGRFYGIGNFCSFNCAYAFILKTSIYQSEEKLALLFKMRERYLSPEHKLTCAPSPLVLEKYIPNGIKIEEYRRSFDNITINYGINMNIPKKIECPIETIESVNSQFFRMVISDT